jgi:hypothetical protein
MSDRVPGGGILSSDTDASASANGAGRPFPRFSARRRIPAQAFGLKKNRCGTLPESSSMSDNKHTAAALGHAEELSVKNPVGEPIPELCQHPEEGRKVPSSSTRQNSGDVLPDHPTGANSASQRAKLKHEVAARIIQPLAESRDAE